MKNKKIFLEVDRRPREIKNSDGNGTKDEQIEAFKMSPNSCKCQRTKKNNIYSILCHLYCCHINLLSLIFLESLTERYYMYGNLRHIIKRLIST